MTKMEELMESEGYDSNEFEEFMEFLMDSVNPGICMNKGCSYTTTVEPDSTTGYCEICKTRTVCAGSMLIFNGV